MINLKCPTIPLNVNLFANLAPSKAFSSFKILPSPIDKGKKINCSKKSFILTLVVKIYKKKNIKVNNTPKKKYFKFEESKFIKYIKRKILKSMIHQK